MKRRSVLAGVVVTVLALGQTGCSLGLTDAARAGVYDFVSASVTDLLGVLSPLNWLVDDGENE